MAAVRPCACGTTPSADRQTGTKGRIIAGIGCRAACPALDILAVVRRAQDTALRRAEALAAPDFKSHEPGLHEAARALGVPLLLVAATALRDAQPRCVTISVAAERATGFASVAEGSALAAAGIGGRLLLPRIAGPRATCALAEEVA